MNLIIGATGMVGSEICRLLISKGEAVKVTVRETSDKEKVNNLKKLGVQIENGDLRDPASMENAVKGVKRVFTTLSSMPFSYVPGENDIQKVDLEGLKNLIDIAKNAGVEHFIYTSFSGQLDVKFPLSEAKRTVEQYLMNSGMTYTILRPSCFMEVWLSPAVGFDVQNSKVQLCGDGKMPISYISFLDVAKFAAESIVNPAAKDAILELGGPDAISQLDAVKIFEEASGKKFEIQHIPESALHAQMEEATDPMQKSFSGLMYCVAKGDLIDMKEMLKNFSIKLTSVKEFAQAM